MKRTGPMRSTGRSRLVKGIASLAGITALVAVLAGPVPAAYAAAGVTVTSSLGTATADAEYSTGIHVAGSGFQSIQGGMGGIYVLFGWVDPGGWLPSAAGVVGSDYLYVPDSEAKDNQGFQRFVAFPGSETEAAAQAVMSADGAWEADMTIPGATFQALDRDGNATSVDCLSVQCGIITIGAHGIKNANNETFTPIAFVVPTATAAGGTDGGEPVAAAEVPVSTAAVGQLALGVNSAKASAGNALPFTARGFAVGEQVVASLDGGVVAVGPLTAGNAGEVAGVLPLPVDLAAGTHVLSVQGAATDGSVEAEIVIAANPLATAATAVDPSTPAWLLIVTVIAIALALLLIVTSIIASIVRSSRRRRTRQTDAAIPPSANAPIVDVRIPRSAPPLPAATTPAAAPPATTAPDGATLPIPVGTSA